MLQKAAHLQASPWPVLANEVQIWSRQSSFQFYCKARKGNPRPYKDQTKSFLFDHSDCGRRRRQLAWFWLMIARLCYAKDNAGTCHNLPWCMSVVPKKSWSVRGRILRTGRLLHVAPSSNAGTAQNVSILQGATPQKDFSKKQMRWKAEDLRARKSCLGWSF